MVGIAAGIKRKLVAVDFIATKLRYKKIRVEWNFCNLGRELFSGDWGSAQARTAIAEEEGRRAALRGSLRVRKLRGMVLDAGFEPATPTMSMWCSTPELTEHVRQMSGAGG